MTKKVPALLKITLLILLLFYLMIPKLYSFQSTENRYQFSPKTYVVHKITDPLTIDGELKERAWQETVCTEPFVDIQGTHLPPPRFQTTAKMLWDDEYLYIAAQLEEPHLWATIEERDAVIFQENNFEIFIDPDGDTHNYYELEINALQTFWDLMLTQPYRTGGKPINAWDIKGLKIGVDLQGTLNDPSDIDEGWTLEIGIPLDVLNETVRRNQPVDGEKWRLNFSRVEWLTKVEEGKYVKETDPETGEAYPEDNWVWSPQGLINMHLPERWGIIQFSDQPPGSNISFTHSPYISYEWKLRQLYYQQRDYRRENGRYAEDPGQLQVSSVFDSSMPEGTQIEINVLGNSYLMSLTAEDLDQIFYIREDSRAWMEMKN